MIREKMLKWVLIVLFAVVLAAVLGWVLAAQFGAGIFLIARKVMK